MRIRIDLTGQIVLIALLWTSTSALAVRPAVAQEIDAVPRLQKSQDADQVEARRSQLLKRMIANPADLETAFEYAALSSQAGDLESAISTLERMLIFAPDLPRLQLELGVLYFRLGAHDVAQVHFDNVMDAPNLPDRVKLRVESYLEEIRNQTVATTFNGAIMFGVRHQTNANGGVDDRIVDLNGFEFLLSNSALAESDTNGFASGSFHFSHDFATQGDRFDAELVTYGAVYAEHDEINTGLAEARLGPVFNMERFGWDDTELGVYAILGGVVLDSDAYRLTGGAGARLSKALNPQTRAETRFEYRYQDYRDSARRPFTSLRSGDEYRLQTSLQHQLNDRMLLYGVVDVERSGAELGYEKSWEVEGIIGANYSFRSPFPEQQQMWTAGISVGLAERRYDDPNPIIDAGEEQRNVEHFIRGTLSVPLGETWSLQTLVSYQDVHSNYDLDSFNNLSTAIGLMKRF
jgi:tetratricopeptide (TPR) repeat protein